MSRDSLDDVRTDRYHDESAASSWGLVGGLVVIVLYLVLAWVVVHYPSASATSIRFVVAVPLVLFLPGYAFLSALFPGRQESAAKSSSSLSRTAQFDTLESIEHRGITWGERVALSFGMSMIWLPILALALSISPWGLNLDPIFGVISAFVLGWSVIGAVRRARLAPSERFIVPYRRWLIDARTAFGRSPADALLTGVLALSVLAAAASLTYALAVPTDATEFTNFGVGTVNESGQLVYTAPPNFTDGQPQDLTFLIENHEERSLEYTVVVQLQEVRITEVRCSNTGEVRRNNFVDQCNNIPAGERANTTLRDLTVLDRQPVDRFSTTLSDNESTLVTRTVTPATTGAAENRRVVFLLYRGEPAANPTVANAYRHTYYWLNVDSAPPANGSRQSIRHAAPGTTTG